MNSRCFKLTCLALLWALFTAPLPAAEEGDLRERPGSGQEPSLVRLSLYVIDITSIDSASGSFMANFLLRYRWKDDRLPAVGTYLSPAEIWYPRLAILNQRDARTSLGEFIHVVDEGTAQFTHRYQGTFSADYDFRKFPFDQQVLPITVLAAFAGTEDLQLQFDSAGSVENLTVSGWALSVEGAVASDFETSMSGEATEYINRSRLDFKISAERNVNYYRWKVLLPLSIVVFLSWAVFMIKPQQIAPQIGVSATSILTLIAFLIRLEGLLPPVSYLTHMDKFVYSALMLVFLAYAEALTTSRLAASDHTLPLAEAIDRWSRVLFPLAYGIIVYAFWVV